MSGSKKRSTALVLASMALGGVGTFAVSGGSAEAVPPAQSRCSFNTKGITVSDGWQPLGLAVSIDNGDVARRVIAQLVTDMGVETNAEVRVGYSIDGGPVQEKVYGPGNLANNQEFWETRSTMAVIPLPKGTHRVSPYWRISAGANQGGAFENGCFTVEGRTS